MDYESDVVHAVAHFCTVSHDPLERTPSWYRSHQPQELNTPMPGRRLPTFITLASKSAELAVAAPQVASQRLLRMMLAGGRPSARDRREFERMVMEKQAAFIESWMAMSVSLIRANAAIAASMFSSRGGLPAAALHARWRRAGVSSLSAGLAPIHRKATANAKRLRRVKASSR